VAENSGEYILKQKCHDGKSGKLSLVINDVEKEISTDYNNFKDFQFTLKKDDKLIIKIFPNAKNSPK
jgi:hypothetical protein